MVVDLRGQSRLVFHSPNQEPHERAQIELLDTTGDTVRLISDVRSRDLKADSP